MDVRLSKTNSTVFLTLSNDTYVSKSLEVYGEWSYDEILLISKVVKSTDNIIEVGANVGAHTVFISRDICKHGIVYAFEPRRLLFQFLCANLVLNGLDNVHCFQVGLGDQTHTFAEGPVPTQSAINAGVFELGKIPGVG
jgi:hypothetical protein